MERNGALALGGTASGAPLITGVGGAKRCDTVVGLKRLVEFKPREEESRDIPAAGTELLENVTLLLGCTFCEITADVAG